MCCFNNYDLCSTCEEVNSSGDTFGSIHDKTHAFLKIATVAQTPMVIAAAINEDKANANPHEVPKPGPWRRGGGRWGAGGGSGRWGMPGGFPHHPHHPPMGFPPPPPPHHPMHWGPGHHPGGPVPFDPAAPRWGGPWRRWGPACGNNNNNGTNQHQSTGNATTTEETNDPVTVLLNAAAALGGNHNTIAETTINGESMPNQQQEEDRLLDLALKESLEEATLTGSAVTKVIPTPTAPVVAPSTETIPNNNVTNASQALPFTAKLVSHVSTNDKETSSVYPGTKIIKAWRMKNDGNEPWPENCRLVFVGGDLIGAPPNGIEVPSVKPGETIDIAVPFYAPDEPGRYTSNWRMYAPNYNVPNNTTKDGKKKKGVRFGPRVWADIFVERPPSSSSSSGSSDEQTVRHPDSTNNSWVNITTSNDGKKESTEEVWDEELAKALAASLQMNESHHPSTNDTNTTGTEVNNHDSHPTTINNSGGDIPVFPEHLATLSSMGFDDTILNSQLLVQHKGNIIRVVSALLEAKGINTSMTPNKKDKEEPDLYN